MNKIYVLGVGPGAKDYLPPLTVEKAAGCDILVGGMRSLALFKDLEKEKIEITGHLDPVIEAIRQKRDDKRIAVLVSGDTGIYSFLPKLAEAFGRGALEVHPGISAAQYLFARLGLCWHEAVFISLHGRSLDDLALMAGKSKQLVVFTDPGHTPALVCRRLVETGLKERNIYLGENLSYPEEKISCGRPEDFITYEASTLNIIIVESGKSAEKEQNIN